MQKKKKSVHFFSPNGVSIPDTGSVPKDVVELVVALWEAGGVDVAVAVARQLDGLLQKQDGDVVAETHRVVVAVVAEPTDGKLSVVLRLGTVEPAGVVLDDPNLQQTVKKR